MARESSAGVATEQSSGAHKSNHETLKARLLELWNSYEPEKVEDISDVAARLESRGRLASFIHEGSRILDVACGTTANVEWFARRGTYFGTDLCIGYLRVATTNERRLTCADAERLPFGDGAFDAATLTFALEHTVNPVGVLREMCRVVGNKGRVILLGPNWDLPFWYPNALSSQRRRSGWLVRYSVSRFLGQLKGWIFGRLPFLIVEEPDVFVRGFEIDADAVYVVWSYEVIRQMKRWGFRLIHGEVDDRLLGANFAVRALKRLLFLLPIYRLAGSTALLVFERE